MSSLHLEQFDFESLSTLDNGIPNQLLKSHLRRVAADIDDRKGDATKRTVTIQIDFVPVLDTAGQLKFTKTTLDIKSKVPVHRSETYQLAVDPKRGMFVNADFPTQLDHRSLFDEAPAPDQEPVDEPE